MEEPDGCYVLGVMEPAEAAEVAGAVSTSTSLAQVGTAVSTLLGSVSLLLPLKGEGSLQHYPWLMSLGEMLVYVCTVVMGMGVLFTTVGGMFIC